MKADINIDSSKVEMRLFNTAVIGFLLRGEHKNRWNKAAASKLQQSDLQSVQRYLENSNNLSPEDKLNITKIMRQGFLYDPELSYRLSVYNDHRTVLAERLDIAYGIVQRIGELQKQELNEFDKNFLSDLKNHCINHLCIILNLSSPNEIEEKMRDRIKHRTENPDYIPGKIEISWPIQTLSAIYLGDELNLLLKRYAEIPPSNVFEKLIALAKLGHKANRILLSIDQQNMQSQLTKKREHLQLVIKRIEEIDDIIERAKSSHKLYLDVAQNKRESSSAQSNAARRAKDISAKMDTLTTLKMSYQKSALAFIRMEKLRLDQLEYAIKNQVKLLNHVLTQVVLTLVSIGVPDDDDHIQEMKRMDAEEFETCLNSSEFMAWINQLHLKNTPSRWPFTGLNLEADSHFLYMKTRKAWGDFINKTPHYDYRERNEFRVLIGKNNGFFREIQSEASVYRSDTFSSTKMESHGKPKYCAFTINIHGEISMFSHLDGEPDELGRAHKHSSMNGLHPVIAAGEVMIDENGKLLLINDHSWHYRPQPIHIYRALKVFQKQGVNVNDVIAYFTDPIIELAGSQSDDGCWVYCGKDLIDHFDSQTEIPLLKPIDENHQDSSVLYLTGNLSKIEVMIQFLQDISAIKCCDANLPLDESLKCEMAGNNFG